MAALNNLVVSFVDRPGDEQEPAGPWRLHVKTEETETEETDTEKTDTKETETRETEIKKTLLDRIKSFISPEGTPPPVSVANILREFLQPDSKTSLDAVTRAILVLIPEKYFSPEVYNFGDTVCELAEQIPYHHPAHHKLARLMQYLAESHKFFQVFSDPVLEKKLLLHPSLGEALCEAHYCDDDALHEYVNINAFAANLENAGIFGRTFAAHEIRWGLEGDVNSHLEATPADVDTYIMSAAVYIIYNGPNLFRQMVLYPNADAEDDLEAQDSLARYWRLGKDLMADKELRKMKPRSVERWRFWQSRLDKIAKGEDGGPVHSEECRSLARRAAIMAEAIEKSMLF